MSNELLPCPFCGGTQDENGVIDHDEKCFVYMLIDALVYGTGSKKKIEKAWNTRAQTVFGMTLDEVRQMMKRDAERERTCKYVGDEISGGCSECRGWLDPACAYCPSCGAKVVE